MLGDVVGEVRGQVTSMRALPAEDGNARVEVTMSCSGNVLDNTVDFIATYVSLIEDDGTMRGRGDGWITGADGKVLATCAGGAIGETRSGGQVHWRGYAEWSPRSEVLANLRNSIILYEADIDAVGKSDMRFFEWK